MNVQYMISQLFVIFAIISLGISYLKKDKKEIMILCIICSIFYGGGYLLLGAYTGLAMNIVSIVRNIWFYNNAKNKKENSVYVLLALFIIAIIFSLITFENIFSLVSLFATLLFTYSVWQDNVKVYRWMALPVSALWILYNAYFKSLLGIISESVLLVIEIIGIIKLYNRKNS